MDAWMNAWMMGGWMKGWGDELMDGDERMDIVKCVDNVCQNS